MDPVKMDAILDLMSQAELRRGLWMIDVWESAASIDRPEASEWRRRLVARQVLMDLRDDALAN